MENDETKLTQQIENSFGKVLNSNGYGFQFSVIKKACDLSQTGRSHWKFETIEFPVDVKGRDTRIDFVFSRGSSQFKTCFLLAECKRANPALSNWCFARAPYRNRKKPGGSADYLFFEHIDYKPERTPSLLAYAKKRDSTQDCYQIGVEVRSNQKGDSYGEKGEAIELAATQVMRGLNGYVEAVSKNTQVLKGHSADLIPVIFTTATLWVSEINLSSAELQTGICDITKAGFKQVPWLCYQYHLSPEIKHANSPQDRSANISELMDCEYVRTIPIVSPSGVEEFLSWSSHLDLFD